MARARLDPSRFDEFRRLASQWSDQRVGRHFGMGATTAARWRRRLGITRLPLPKSLAVLTAMEQARLQELWGKAPLRDLAKVMHRCEHTLRKYAAMLGLPSASVLRPRPPQVVARYQHFLQLVSDPAITVRKAAQLSGVSITQGKRLRPNRRPEGNRFPGVAYHPGVSRLTIKELRERRERQETMERPGVRWRCWHCDQLNLDNPVCVRCGTRLGEKL